MPWEGSITGDRLQGRTAGGLGNQPWLTPQRGDATKAIFSQPIGATVARRLAFGLIPNFFHAKILVTILLSAKIANLSGLFYKKHWYISKSLPNFTWQILCFANF
jgi:hypothetical protein